MPDIVANAIALFCAWLFALAAWHKWRNAAYFAGLLQAYLPQAWARAGTARVLAAVEAALVFLLLLPDSRMLALLAAAALLLGYAGLMTWQLLQGRADLKCGCAGPGSDASISLWLVTRNLLCAVLALSASQALLLVPPGLLDTLLTVFITLLCGLLYECFEQLHSNAQRFALEET